MRLGVVQAIYESKPMISDHKAEAHLSSIGSMRPGIWNNNKMNYSV